jgi:hypothetical protein
MRAGWLALAILALTTIGCESLSGTGRLVADLHSLGLQAAMGTEFDPGLLDGERGRAVCVGAESVQVYEFADANAAVEAARKVNPKDPSNVGNGIVEWIGPPRFWRRDNVIVTYVGGDVAVDRALRGILGRPFADSGVPGGPLRHGAARPCAAAT